MICVVDSNHHLRPYTFNDEYTILSNEEAIFGWAISFIQDIVDMVFGSIVDAISNLVDSYCSGVQSALKRAEMDVSSTGSVSPSSLSMLSSALQGDLYWVLLGVATAIEVVLLAITPITIGFGFLISIAISLIVAVVVQEALKVDETEQWEGELATESTEDGILQAMQGFEGNQGSTRDEKMKMAWAIMAGVMGIWSGSIGLRVLAAAESTILPGLALVASVISVVLGYSSLIIVNDTIAYVVALGSIFSAISAIIVSVGDIILNTGALSVISTFIGLIGLACAFEGMKW